MTLVDEDCLKSYPLFKQSFILKARLKVDVEN